MVPSRPKRCSTQVYCHLVSCRWSSASPRAACCSGLAPVLKRCTTWCWAAGRGSPTWGWTSRRSTACSRASPRPHPCTWTYWADAPLSLYVLCVHVCVCELGLRTRTSGCVCLKRRRGEEEMKAVRVCERLCTVPGCKCSCKCYRPCPHYIEKSLKFWVILFCFTFLIHLQTSLRHVSLMETKMHTGLCNFIQTINTPIC